MERLFLLEILTEKIKLCTAYNPLPPKHDITLTIIFGDITMKIADDETKNDAVDPESLEIEFNTGKSVLFPSTCESLLYMMNNTPLILNIEYKNILISSLSILWSDLFTYMVENCEDNFLSPVSNKDTYNLLNNRGEKIGEVQLFMRLSSFGRNIQTSFKVVQSDEGSTKKFFFKGPEKNTVFQTQRSPSHTATSNEMRSSASTIPITPISKTNIQSPVSEPKSFIRGVKNSQSVSQGMHSAHYSHVRYQESQMSDTLVWRKKIEKVMFTSPVKQIEQIQKLSYAPSKVMINSSQSHNRLNYNRIESIPSLNEMCQTAEGCYCFAPKFQRKHSSQYCRRPKTANFSGDYRKVSGLCNGCQKLSGGCPPLRLKGGGPGIFDELPILQLPTPSEACRDLMDEIDACLQAFKNAMGPCGKVYCPYAPNVTHEICRRVCECQVKQSEGNEAEEESGSEIEPDSPILEKFKGPNLLFPECYREDNQNNLLNACGVPTCPFSRQPDPKLSHKKPYCQSATCPKAKRGIEKNVDEHKIWMQQIGPTFGQRCGQPNKCPYPIPSKLPPIHWECPEALPNGQCQNPSCPYTPAILRKKVPPCGNMDCRHSSSSCICCTCVPFPACGNPNCPNQTSTYSPCPQESLSKPDISCANPKCPNKPIPENETNTKLPRCTCADLGSEECDNATCPFKLTHICGNSNCPFNSNRRRRRNTSTSSNKPINKNSLKNEGTFDAQFVDERLKPCKKSGEFSSNSRIRGGCDEGSKRNKSGCEGGRQVCSGKDCCKYNEEKKADCGSINPSANSADNYECDNPNCPFETADFCTTETCRKITNKGNYSKESKSKPCQFNENELFICNDPACPWAIPCIPCPTCLPPCPSPCSPCPPCLPCPYTLPCPFEDPCSYLYPDISRKTDPCAELKKQMEEKNSVPCQNNTCKSEGGDQTCRTCSKQTTLNESKSGAGGGDDVPEKPSAPQKPAKESKSTAVSNKSEHKDRDSDKKKKRKTKKFAYFIGDKYPGNTIGHTHCVIPGKQVPHNKGWLWNVHVPCLSLKRRRGWKPGLIGRTIATRIQQYWQKKGIKSLTIPPARVRRRMKGAAFESSSEESIPPQSTLQVKKRNGTYWITMNPLKDPYKIADNENPYMDCTPMQFKITKKDNRECFCGEDEENETDSELDIDFTPPAGIIRPERLKKKKTIVHVEAQYDPKDFAPPKTAGKGKGKEKGKGKGKDGKKKKGKK